MENDNTERIRELSKFLDEIYDAKEKRRVFLCKRCGHVWLSSLVKPVKCAKCKSAYWHIDGKYKIRKAFSEEGSTDRR
jgi:predicted Zn-ribbon and HTH transcriptional regulator